MLDLVEHRSPRHHRLAIPLSSSRASVELHDPHRTSAPIHAGAERRLGLLRTLQTTSEIARRACQRRPKTDPLSPVENCPPARVLDFAGWSIGEGRHLLGGSEAAVASACALGASGLGGAGLAAAVGGLAACG